MHKSLDCAQFVKLCGIPPITCKIIRVHNSTILTVLQHTAAMDCATGNIKRYLLVQTVLCSILPTAGH